jgi:hypothetical protein
VKYYPRGEKNCADLSINFFWTPEWFEKHGVLKIEDDGRMFPFPILPNYYRMFSYHQKTGNRSLDRTKRTIYFQERESWKIETQNENYLAEKLILLQEATLKYGK